MRLFNIPVLGGDVVLCPRAGIIYGCGCRAAAGGCFVMQSDRDSSMDPLKILSLGRGLPECQGKAIRKILAQESGNGQAAIVGRGPLKKVMQLKTET